MSKTLRVAIAGGGTGGHLFPALNLGRAMQERWQAQLLFFGTKRGLENRILPEKGYRLELLPVQGFQRRLTLKNLTFPLNLARSLRKSRKILQAFRPHLVLGTGGYVMGPVLKTAKKMGFPVVIQEQNSYPGVTTRLLAKQADLLFLGYEEALKYLPDGINAVVTGNPVKMEAVYRTKEEAKKALGWQPDLPLVAVIGGSQGAQSINEALFKLLQNRAIATLAQWLWQTGKAHFTLWQEKVAQMNLTNVRTEPFIEQMAVVYQAADLVICRAGAMTLSELMAMGAPAVLIPFPFAAADHQYKNAQAMAQKGAALVIKDDAQMAQKLQEVVPELLKDRQKISEMARAMKSLHKKDSIDQMLSLMARLLKERGLNLGEKA